MSLAIPLPEFDYGSVWLIGVEADRYLPPLAVYASGFIPFLMRPSVSGE